MSKIDEVFTAIETGKAKMIAELVQSAIDAGEDPMEILNRGMVSAMSVIGERFSRGEAFVPEMLISARTMKKGVEVLKPHLAKDAVNSLGTAIIGTVQGDMHDIGKNLVAMVAEGGGYEVIDLGIDVPTEKFLDAAAEKPNAVVGLSALLTTTMTNMAETVKAMKAKNPATRIMVGGAPVTEHFAHEIGADCYSADPQGAVDYLNRVMA